MLISHWDSAISSYLPTPPLPSPHLVVVPHGEHGWRLQPRLAVDLHGEGEGGVDAHHAALAQADGAGQTHLDGPDRTGPDWGGRR